MHALMNHNLQVVYLPFEIEMFHHSLKYLLKNQLIHLLIVLVLVHIELVVQLLVVLVSFEVKLGMMISQLMVVHV